MLLDVFLGVTLGVFLGVFLGTADFEIAFPPDTHRLNPRTCVSRASIT